MEFTQAQRDAIEASENLVVVAGAGSGKTRVLVERYVRLLGQHAPERLLAITFTDKAAREMRDRVRARLEQVAVAAGGAERARWELRRDEIEAARIGTIHSFCGALLRAHPAETGLDPRFEVLDEVQAQLLVAESADAALAAVARQQAEAGGADDDLTALFNEFGLGELRGMLAGLLRSGAEARAALERQPAAAAGLLEQWRGRLAAEQQAALAELRADLAWQEAAAAFWHLERLAPPDDVLGAQFVALAPLMRALADADGVDAERLASLGQIGLRGGTAKAWGGKDQVVAARDCLRTLRARYEAFQDVLEAAWDEGLEQRAARAALGLGQLYRRGAAEYARRKDGLNALDFDDLETLALRLLEQHPPVRRRWQAEIAAVLVDEFQDTSPEQRALVYALAGVGEARIPHPLAPSPAAAGEGEQTYTATNLTPHAPSLFIVADGKQSIYRFRGADVAVFTAARADVVAGGGREIALDTSFRAHERLVALINDVFEQVFRRERTRLPYEVDFEPLGSYRPASPHAVVAELHVGAAGADGRRAEAIGLARRVRELVDGSERLVWDETSRAWRTPGYQDIAMLFQASTVFEAYEEALRAEGVPFLTTAGRGYYGRSEVRDLVHLLRFLEDPSDDFSLVGALRSPLFAVDDEAIVGLRLAGPGSLWENLKRAERPDGAQVFPQQALGELLALRGRVGVDELLREALEQTGYLATVGGLRDGERRRVNVEKLLDVARRAGVELSTFGAYLEQALAVEAREAEAPLEGDGALRLMTVHRAKGLEFPIVALPDLGRQPPRSRDTLLALRAYGTALKLRDGADWTQPAAFRVALAEQARMERAERERLMYVAVTRAQDYLLLAGPQAEASGENWLAWLLTALGWPWEQGGPPEGQHLVAAGRAAVRVMRKAEG